MCVIKTHFKCGLLIFAAHGSSLHTCAIIMLFNHVVMPHLSDGWIILAKEKCSQTKTIKGAQKFEKSKLLVCMEKVSHLLLLLMKNRLRAKEFILYF